MFLWSFCSYLAFALLLLRYADVDDDDTDEMCYVHVNAH